MGVTLGNIVGGKLADWKLMPSLMVNFAVLALVIAMLTLTLHHPALTIINIFLWGIAAFGIMPGIQLRIMNLAHKAPLLATTSSHSALNLGNAAGAYLGGLAITSFGLSSIPWLSAVLAVLALAGAWLSYASTGSRASATVAGDVTAAP
ncbi:Inner membrane transport protein YdhP [compost metagenome]